MEFFINATMKMYRFIPFLVKDYRIIGLENFILYEKVIRDISNK